MNLTPGQAHYVLSALISQGKVRAARVRKVLRSREEEIRSLRERLASLEQLAAPGRSPAGRRRRGRAAKKTRTRRPRLSPRIRALRRLQGKYMGYVRRLKSAEKARVRAVREKQGMGAAIRLARSLSAKS